MALQKIGDTTNKFLSISEQLLNITSHKNIDKNVINEYILNLNSLNYKAFSSLENDVAVLLINRLCSHIPATEKIIVKNHCKLIVNLFKIAEDISDRTFTTCKKWLLRALDTNKNGPYINDIIIAFKQLIEVGSVDNIRQDMYVLLSENGLLRVLIAESSSKLTESGVLAIYCIEAFLKSCEFNGKSLLQDYKIVIADIVCNFFQSTQRDEHNLVFYHQAVSSCLRILGYLISDKLLTENENISGMILGIVQVFLFYGINGYLILKPKHLRPASMDIPERIQIVPRYSVQSVNKSRSKRQLKKGKPETLNNSQDSKNISKYSSDSDTSDTESTNPAKIESMIRLEAVNLLLKVIRELSPRDMFGYWPQIIVSTTGINSRVLLSLILKEPVAKLRQTCLSTLAEAILDARTFLTYAEDTEHSAFITFFGTVGAMIKELHLGLSQVLKPEKNFAVITHALKCINALVQVTPYTRLTSGLVTNVLTCCQTYVLHKDPTAKVAALSVFETLASKDKLTPEIIEILSEKSGKSEIIARDDTYPQLELHVVNNDDDVNEEIDYTDAINCKKDSEIPPIDIESDLDRDKNVEICFLLQICLKNISNKNVQVPVRLQSLKLINALINKDIDYLVFNHTDLVVKHLVDTLQETETQVALHSCRVLEKMSSFIKENDVGKHDILMKIWSVIFQHVILLVQSVHINLREVACNCIGTVNNQVFTQWPYDQSILIVTSLFGAARDEESAVRAAALRSLGMLILLPSLEEDSGFLVDLANLSSTALEDENLGVRVKAAWALANLSDCLIKQSKNSDIDPIPVDVLLPSLCKISIRAAQDNNKVKCNALRAVGNVIYLCQELEIPSDIPVGIDILIKCATTGNDMKVRWNACRALGFVISQENISNAAPNWRDKVVPALCNLIQHSPNFKVRTNAAWALANCQSYDKYIPFLWKNIVLALDNSQHVPNFVEYHHRDALVQQLCLTLGHIAARTDLTDLDPLWPEIKDRIPDIIVHMKYFQERVLPEETDDFVNAKLRLDNYTQNAPSPNQRNVAKQLANLFNLTDITDEYN